MYTQEKGNMLKRIFLVLFFIWLTLYMLASLSDAGQSFSDTQAIRCIVGEAEDQGLEGMTAIGEALRNRGSLKGVYGCSSERSLIADSKTYLIAKRAWRASEGSRLVNGADHWENDRGKEAWWEKYGVFVVKIGNHRFYKEVRR